MTTTKDHQLDLFSPYAWEAVDAKLAAFDARLDRIEAAIVRVGYLAAAPAAQHPTMLELQRRLQVTGDLRDELPVADVLEQYALRVAAADYYGPREPLSRAEVLTRLADLGAARRAHLLVGVRWRAVPLASPPPPGIAELLPLLRVTGNPKDEITARAVWVRFMDVAVSSGVPLKAILPRHRMIEEVQAHGAVLKVKHNAQVFAGVRWIDDYAAPRREARRK